MSHLSETKRILKVEQKAFVLFWIKRRTFLGHPVEQKSFVKFSEFLLF